MKSTLIIATVSIFFFAQCVFAKEEKNLLVVYGYEDGKPCPAREFFNDCNYCFCGADKHSAGCYHNACPPVAQPLRSSAKIPVVHGYVQGQPCPAREFFNDCNYCFCGADKHSAGCYHDECYDGDMIL